MDASLMQSLLVYALIFLAPFVQEDAAIFGAATGAATGQGEPAFIFAAVLTGLICSDTWKYWIGVLSHRSTRMSRWATDPRIQKVRDQVHDHLVKALLIARFVPGTRIPLYIACGVFRAPFWKFFALLVTGACAYIGIAFFLIYRLGAMAGEHLHKTLPAIVITIVVVMIAGNWAWHAWRARKQPEDGAAK